MKFLFYTLAAVVFAALFVSQANAFNFYPPYVGVYGDRGEMSMRHSRGKYQKEERHAISAAAEMLRNSECAGHISSFYVYENNYGSYRTRAIMTENPSSTITVEECLRHFARFLDEAAHAAAKHAALNLIARTTQEVADACAVHMGYLSYQQLQARAGVEADLPDGKRNEDIIAFHRICRSEVAGLSDNPLTSPSVVQTLDFCPDGRVCLNLGELVSDRIKTWANRHHEGRNVRENLEFPEPELTTPTASVSTATVSTTTGT